MSAAFGIPMGGSWKKRLIGASVSWARFVGSEHPGAGRVLLTEESECEEYGMTSTRLAVQAVLGVLVLMLTGCNIGGVTATDAPSSNAVSAAASSA